LQGEGASQGCNETYSTVASQKSNEIHVVRASHGSSETQGGNASHADVETQGGDASQHDVESQEGDASQHGIETQKENASQYGIESQKGDASQDEAETHGRGASQCSIETQVVDASHLRFETQEVDASQCSIETQRGNASHYLVGTQEEFASHHGFETQGGNASQAKTETQEGGKEMEMQVGRIEREIARLTAGGYEDIQVIRLMNMNRLRDLVRKINEQIPFDRVEEKKEEKTFDKKYQDSQLLPTIQSMVGEGKLTADQQCYLSTILDIVAEARRFEENYSKIMAKLIQKEPIWNEFLVYIKGIGPILGVQLIKEFGYCEKFDTVSKLWKISGQDVVDGKAPAREQGKKTHFDPKKRTLVWKIGESFIKSKTPYYRDIYDGEKARQLARTGDNKPANQLHAHNRAARKMRKLFLAHYWEASRKIMGLPTRAAYAKEYLGHTDIVSYEDVIKMIKMG